MSWAIGFDEEQGRALGLMFYVYLWLREDGSPYYVGKGSGNRAHKRRRLGNPPPDRVIVRYLPTEAEAFQAEMDLIAHYGRIDQGTGCLRNLTDGGDQPPSHKGKKKSKEWIEKVSAKLKGRKGSPQSEATKNKRRLAMIGRTFLPESIEKMRAAQLGKTLSEETKAKIRIANKERNRGGSWNKARRDAHIPGQRRKNRDMSKVRCMDKSGQILALYESRVDAAKSSGVPLGNISQCCKGRRASAGGYLWAFAEDETAIRSIGGIL